MPRRAHAEVSLPPERPAIGEREKEFREKRGREREGAESKREEGANGPFYSNPAILAVAM